MAKVVGFLLFLATTLHLTYSQTVSFTVTPSDTIVGKDGKLECSTTSSDNIVTWIIKKGSEILIQYDNSFSFMHPSVRNRARIDIMPEKQNRLAIDISPVLCEDDANYTCIIKQDKRTLSSSVIEWTVKDSPQNVALSATFIDLSNDAEIETIIRKPIHLVCQAQLGNPAGHMEWYVAKVGIDEQIKESDYEKTSVNVTMMHAENVKDSCQTAQKSSIKYFPNSLMKVAIRCQAENSLNITAAEKVFKIIEQVESEKVSSTMIIIIVLAVIIPEIIIAIILGIVLYYRRKKQKKKRELEAAEAEEKAALPDRQSRNSFQMKPRTSSKGGRRKRDSSLREKADAPEKQAMTEYRDDPDA